MKKIPHAKILLGLLLIGLYACGGGQSPSFDGTPSNPTSSSQASEASSSQPSNNGGASSSAPVVSQKTGAQFYTEQCASCHGDKGQGAAAGGNLKNCTTCGNHQMLATRIEMTMPISNPSLCDAQCSALVAQYILGGFSNTPVSSASSSSAAISSSLSSSLSSAQSSSTSSVVRSSASSSSIGTIPSSSSVSSVASSVASSVTSSVRSSSSASSISSIASSSQSSFVGNATRGKTLYESAAQNCSTCHGPIGKGIYPLDAVKQMYKHSRSNSEQTLANYITSWMPEGNPSVCVGQCAADIATYIRTWAPASSSSSSSAVSSSTQSSASSSSTQPPQDMGPDSVVAIAINAGGPEIVGSDGIRYLADSHFAGGNVYSINGDIASTETDALYRTERWNTGTLSYNIPLGNGVYDVVLKFAEIFHEVPGGRVFDISIENQRVVTALDLVGQVGPRTAHDITFQGTVIGDGALNIALTGSVDNPKISGIVVYREPNGGEIYRQQCLGCHGNEKGEHHVSGGPLTASECRACSSFDTLASFIDIAMPSGKPGMCKGQCSLDVANYILDNFAGFDGNEEEVVREKVPIAGDILACAQGEDAAFGGLRRITRIEYQNLVSQLFNIPNFSSNNLGTDGKLGNFSINVETPISDLQTNQYMEVGEAVAKNAAANMQSWAPCTAQDDNCVRQIIDQVASRAYRRPLSTQERDRLMAIYRNATGGFQTAMATLLHAVLSSPNFLYHLEFGTGQPLPNGAVPLTSHEIAARLSFFLWRSAPDATLLQAATANQLQTPQQIEVQARRMLQDPRARSAVGRFHLEWLKLAYPESGAAGEAQAIAAIEDTVRTVTELTYTDDGDFKDLFFVSYGYFNQLTKDLYGVTGSPVELGSGGFDKYLLDPMQRGGILSRAGFLSFNTPPSGRGKFIREQLLCGEIPLPPADFIPEIAEGDPNDPPRLRWIEHVSNPACGACHRLMDPLGFGFDHYDDSGRWRNMIGTWPVDATGEIVETSDINGHFDGHVELQQILSTSVDTRACYAIQWFRFAIGREPGVKDSCSLAEINQLAAANDYNIRDVMIAITQSDAFRYRRAEPTQ